MDRGEVERILGAIRGIGVSTSTDSIALSVRLAGLYSAHRGFEIWTDRIITSTGLEEIYGMMSDEDIAAWNAHDGNCSPKSRSVSMIYWQY